MIAVGLYSVTVCGNDQEKVTVYTKRQLKLHSRTTEAWALLMRLALVLTFVLIGQGLYSVYDDWDVYYERGPK